MKIDPAQPYPGGAGGDEQARVRARATDAAVKFEAFFIKQMLGQMRAATRVLADEDSALNKRVNQDLLDLADGQVADAMAGQRAFGIADLLLAQLLPPPRLSAAPAQSPSPQDAGESAAAQPRQP